MGKYLDRLRARNSPNFYSEELTKPTIAPLGSLGSDLSQESPKILGGKNTPENGQNLSKYLRSGTDQTVKSPRVTLAEYGAILNEAVTGADLPPIPPYRLGEPEHEAAWSAWWDAVALQRAHRRGVDE